MSHLTFTWPYLALLLLLIPVWWFIQKKSAQVETIFSYLALVFSKLPLATSSSFKKNLWPPLVFLFLVLSAMRPQYVGEPIEVKQSGRSMFLAVDISESMKIEDMQVGGRQSTRLGAVKSVLGDFLQKRVGDFIGLVLFGSESFLHSPLSSDLETINTFLQEAQIGFLGPKTAIGDALLLSTKKLSEEKGDRVIILLTDGQYNAGVIDPETAADIAYEKGIKIYIVGMGSKEMLVDSFFGTQRVNPSADLETAEPLLKKIAKKTGGAYFRSTDTDSLKKIYQKLDELEPIERASLSIIPTKELFYYPLLGVLILLFLVHLIQRFYEEG